MFAKSKFDEVPSLSDFLLIFCLIVVFKILFFFSGFILEDSFIVFRPAFHLADFGKFSYNLDELNAGTTSKIFGLICAGLRFLFQDYAILSIVMFNTIISFISSFLIFLSVKNIFGEKIITQKPLFYFLIIFIFLNPSISIIGIVGLEFSILVFFMSVILFGITEDSKKILLLSFFIPLIRVEMIGFILIVSFSYLLFLKIRSFLIILFSGFFGVFINGYLNLKYDGSFFPGTAIAKWSTLSNEGDFSYERIFDDLYFWFFGSRSFFLGIYSKFIPTAIYSIIAILIIFLCIYYLRFLLINKYKYADYKNKIFFISISASIILLPLSYVIGGHIWDWYLYPYAFLSYVLLSVFLINLKIFKYINTISVMILILLTIFQFVILKNIGFQENSYRTVVGKDIFQMSSDPQKDTLFLEPSGYIPYYAKIKTYDTVGLSSPEIKKYRDKYKNERWWLDFIEDYKPTFILDRSDLAGGYSHDGEYRLNKNEINWFFENYTLLKKYKYHDYVKKFAGSLEPFYLQGNHSKYFLYKKIN